MKALLFLIGLFCCSRTAMCQASWPYHFDFILSDQQGNPITAEQITSGDYWLFSAVQGDSWFHCDSQPGHFSLSGTAVNTPVHLGLIHGKDTTLVRIPNGTGGMNLANWPAEPGIYRIELSEGDKDKQVQLTESLPQRHPLYLLMVADWHRYRLVKPRRNTWELYFGRLGYGVQRLTRCQ